MRPKLQDPPGHRHPMTQCLEGCSYQSQTGLAYRNCYTNRGVTDLKCLNMFVSVASDRMASNRSPCTHSQVNALRSQAPAPACAAHSGAHSGSVGVKSGAASYDITSQRGSVRVRGRHVSALLGSHKQEHTEVSLTHDKGGCDENKSDENNFMYLVKIRGASLRTFIFTVGKIRKGKETNTES